MLLTTEQAAEFLAITPRMLRGLVLAGIVPCVKINRRVFRFRRESLDEWVKKRERAAVR
ncbi:MAG: helix-turn-helix domain-containing protein [Limisphaerales bacterium]